MLAHELPEILVGRRHHPHVDPDGLGATQTLELLLLQGAQQLGLKFQRHVANLVQKERAAIRHLKSPLGLRPRSREGASFVAEKFALQQRPGIAAQLSATKRLAAARTGS